jgi:short-subunit dehydrogenase
MPITLRGSTALLTGASRGLGARIAERLAREGVHLVLAARDEPRLQKVAAACVAHDVRVRAVAADLSQRDDRERLVAGAGQIDILINNAAIEHTLALIDQTEEEIAAQIATNLTAPIALTRLVLTPMIARRRGAIVNLSSMSGKASTPFNSVYAGTKHGINGFTQSLRLELEGTGVHAGVVCPSFVAETGMWANSGGRAPAMLREVSPDKVVRGVLAVLHGAPEVLVTPGPMRPLLALRELFPRIEGPFMRKLGVTEAFKQRASVNKR